MASLDYITHNGKNLGLCILHGPQEEGIHFYTADPEPLQVGKHFYQAGKVILPHIHCPVHIEQKTSMQEVLYIEQGRVRVTFYTEEGEKITDRILAEGDILILMEGAHGFEFLEQTKMIEIKQGPYNPQSRKRITLKENVK